MTFKTAPKNKRSQAGNGKVLVVVVLLVAGGVAAALWLKGDCGWGKGGGGGSGDDTAAEEPEKPAEKKEEVVKPAAPERPLVIVVDGERYLHNDVEVDIKKVIELAGKVPEGSGAPVRIVRKDSALARAEEELEQKLREAGFVPQIEDEKDDSE